MTVHWSLCQNINHDIIDQAVHRILQYVHDYPCDYSNSCKWKCILCVWGRQSDPNNDLPFISHESRDVYCILNIDSISMTILGINTIEVAALINTLISRSQSWISHVVCQSHPSNNDLPFTLHRSHISCRTLTHWGCRSYTCNNDIQLTQITHLLQDTPDYTCGSYPSDNNFPLHITWISHHTQDKPDRSPK